MQIKQLFVFMRKLKFDCYNNITKVTKNNRAENLHFSKKCGLITTNCVFDKILTTKGSRIKHSRILVLNYANHREDKFLRTNNKHTENGKKQVTAKKTSRALKPISFISAIILASACLLIPTTTLAPSVDAYADSRAAAYSVGGIDTFSQSIAENCAETVPTETADKKAEETTAATKTTEKATKPTTAPAKENKTETKATTKPVEEKEEETQPTESVQTYLVSIDNPDTSYSPSRVTLSDYDRAKLERLVMGEAGTMGYEGCALVAQSIRDAMNLSGNTSIDYIIDEYKYYAPTNIEPNSDVKAAVSYIFDNNGSAVQHRIICFYTGESNWHETQNFIISCGNVRFFDLAV